MQYSKSRLICCVIGQDCQDTIGMCLESVKDSDEVVYLDGGSTDETIGIFSNFLPSQEGSKSTFIVNIFDKEDSNAISKQRNFYLNYLKENYSENDWVLVLDADEVLDTNGINKLKEYIKSGMSDIYSIKMRHLMNNLVFEDSTKPFHFVPNRLFKLSSAIKYPEGEHCILNGELGEGKIANTQIWHLAYLGGAWAVKKRYDQQKLRNNGHPEDFLNDWNKAHLLGQYPVKQFNPVELPETILSNFGIDRDELYFAGRGLEVKHFIDASNWKEFFKCKTATEWGCGLGPRVYAMNSVGIKSNGIELSHYAVRNRISNVFEGDIVTSAYVSTNNNSSIFSDLAVAYDVLEHLEYDDLEQAIETLINSANKFILVSIPFKGTPNCDADPTHIIKEDRDWWVKQFTEKKLTEVEVPEHFLFKEQLLIFKKL